MNKNKIHRETEMLSIIERYFTAFGSFLFFLLNRNTSVFDEMFRSDICIITLKFSRIISTGVFKNSHLKFASERNRSIFLPEKKERIDPNF